MGEKREALLKHAAAAHDRCMHALDDANRYQGLIDIGTGGPKEEMPRFRRMKKQNLEIARLARIAQLHHLHLANFEE